MNGVTQIFLKIERGEPHAGEQLLSLVCDELRWLIKSKAANQKSIQTIQSTLLVDEAFIQLFEQTRRRHGNNSQHVLTAAADPMPRRLMEQARQRSSLQLRANRKCIEAATVDPVRLAKSSFAVLDLDEARQKSASQHPHKAHLNKPRFFASSTSAATTSSLISSTSTAENVWACAQSWRRVRASVDGPRFMTKFPSGRMTWELLLGNSQRFQQLQDSRQSTGHRQQNL